VTTTLTILIPHYNDPAGLALSLKSITGQTWKGDREVIVVDDGSTADNVAKLEEVVEASVERVRLIKNPVNRGRPYTRNVLLDAADGKYTTWLDAGDEYYPQKIELQLDALYRARLTDPGATIWCTCHSDWLWAGAPAKKMIIQQVGDDQVSHLLTGNLRAYLYTLLGPTQTFKDVGYFDLSLPRLQDLDFFLRFVAKGGTLIVPPGPPQALCIYYKSDVGKNGDEVLRSNQHILRKHAGLLLSHSRRFRRNRRFQQFMLAARFTNNNDDTARTAQYLAQSALANPFGFARWLIKSKGRL
jgi:glycosyltransferase involved in cell wall biosynthesis